MKQTKVFFATLAIAAALLPAKTFALTTIIYSSPNQELGETSTGAPITQATFTFALGVFPGLTPTSGNMGSWVADFTMLDSLPWQDDPQDGVSLGNGQGELGESFTLAANSTAGGLQAYIWGYNNNSTSAATQWVLLTNPSWTMPSPAGNPAPVQFDTSNPGTVAVLGQLSGTTSNGINVYIKSAPASVPEPGTFALLSIGAAAGMLFLRRRSA